MQFNLGYINKIAVVEIVLQEGDPVYHYQILKRSKKGIDFVKSGQNFKTVEELVKKVSARYPVLVHFSGKGVLNRKVAYTENYRNTILLNANLNDFYFTDYIEEKQVFGSIIRRDTADDHIKQLINEKLTVVSVSSGPFVIARVNEVLEKEVIETQHWKLQFENEVITDFKKNNANDFRPKNYTLGEEQVSSQNLTQIAVGAAYFNPSEKIVYPDAPAYFEVATEEAKQKNIFTRFGIGMMVFFLIVLSGVRMYNNHLNQVIADNEIYIQDFDILLDQIASMEEEKSRKEGLLQSSGLLNKNFLSFYLMEVSNSLPREVMLDDVIVRPVVGEIKKRKKIDFHDHLIRIQGNSKTSQLLSDWIAVLEEKEWVKKVDIIFYEYVKNRGLFELEMHLN